MNVDVSARFPALEVVVILAGTPDSLAVFITDCPRLADLISNINAHPGPHDINQLHFEAIKFKQGWVFFA